MKDYYLTPSSSGIGLIQKENMPVREEYGCNGKPYCCKGERCRWLVKNEEYEAFLKRAISEAVLVADQGAANEILRRNGFVKVDGQVYGPFTGEYEIQVLESLPPKYLAILSEEKEPVKESQEDMLREILDNYRELQHWRKHEGSKESDESFILTELEKFKITRR